jgi:ribosomal protein S20
MPSIKFLRETNGALCDIWNVEDGITEATKNIATQSIKNIVMDMRKAIDAGDTKSEEKFRKLAEKEMMKLSKPIMIEFNKAFDKFTKDQASYLSDKYGLNIEFWRDGKLSIGMGTQQSSLDAKAGFSGSLIVSPSFDEDKTDDESEAEIGEIEWGFDLTSFDKPANFEKLLKMLGINPKAEKKDETFFWKGSDIEIRTGANPITGEYRNSNRSRDPLDGYASYIGIKGEADKVKKAAAYIRKFDPKDETPNSAGFI